LCEKVYLTESDHVCFKWMCIEPKYDANKLWELRGKYLHMEFEADGNTRKTTMVDAANVEWDLFSLHCDFQSCMERNEGEMAEMDGWPTGDNGRFLPSRECEVGV